VTPNKVDRACLVINQNSFPGGDSFFNLFFESSIKWVGIAAVLFHIQSINDS
jgi:hypothetical protein